MWKKILLASLFCITCIGSYGLVFWNTLVFSGQIQFLGSASSSVYTDIPHLATNVMVFQSDFDISQARIVSSCAISSRYLEKVKDISFFEVDFSQDQKCKNGNIVLELDGKKLPDSLWSLDLKNSISQLTSYTDYPSSMLEDLSKKLEIEQKKYAIYKNYKKQDIARYYRYLQGQRKFHEAVEQKNMIDMILTGREQKYASPVPGRNVAEKFTKIPNSARPYRENYTDGIHHGWDIDAPIGTEVAALDDGVIVRVVRDFSQSDFSRIVYSEKLTDEQKLKNLDILRGKQVWLKTLKGEVVFYSHLDSIPLNIQEAVKVKRGEKLGTVGISGVPEEGYDDSHLHFEIAQNPYTFELAWTYDFWDYMAWSWLTKWLGEAQTLAAQKNIFE